MRPARDPGMAPEAQATAGEERARAGEQSMRRGVGRVLVRADRPSSGPDRVGRAGQAGEVELAVKPHYDRVDGALPPRSARRAASARARRGRRTPARSARCSAIVGWRCSSGTPRARRGPAGARPRLGRASRRAREPRRGRPPTSPRRQSPTAATGAGPVLMSQRTADEESPARPLERGPTTRMNAREPLSRRPGPGGDNESDNNRPHAKIAVTEQDPASRSQSRVPCPPGPRSREPA